MKIMTSFLVLFCTMAVNAEVLRIYLDPDWKQPYVVSGNSNEVVAKIILDGTQLDREVFVPNIPMTLSLSNLPLSAFTNCIIRGQSSTEFCMDTNSNDCYLFIFNAESPPLNSNFLSGFNTFTFPMSSTYVGAGSTTTLYMVSGISSGITESQFQWGLARDYISQGLCQITPQGIICDICDGGIIRFDGTMVPVELVTTPQPWIPVVSRGLAKLTLTVGATDEYGVRKGKLFGKGRPYHRYSIIETMDFDEWFYHEPVIGPNGLVMMKTDWMGRFASEEFNIFPLHQRARFYLAPEERE